MNQSKSVNYIEEACKKFDRRMDSVGVTFARFELVKRIADAEAENARLRRLLKELHTGEETRQEKSGEVEPPPVIVEGDDAAKQAADDLFWINFHKKQQSEKAEPQ